MKSFRELPQVHRSYFWHALFFRIGLGVSDVYGAYLFYELTHSIFVVLAVLLGAYVVGFFARWYSLFALLPFLRRTNGVVVVGFCLALLAGVNLALFFFQQSVATNVLLFSALLAIFFSANGMYFLFSNMLKYSILGEARQPGLYSSFLEIGRALSIVIAGVVALTLNHADVLLGLFLFGAIFLACSLIPLRSIPAINAPDMTFNPSPRNLLRRLSTRALFANVGHGLVADTLMTLIPLYLVVQYAGVDTPVSVTSIALILSALLLYIVGMLWDKQSHRWIFMMCGGAFVAGLALVPYAALTPYIGALLLTLGIVQGILRVGYDARLGADVAARGHALESSVLMEMARCTGSVIAVGIGCIAVALSGVITAPALIIAALLTTLFVSYAITPRGS